MMSQWHYAIEGKQQGPVGIEQLKQLAAAGTLKPQDMVWMEGMTQWVPAKEVSEIFPPAGNAGSSATSIAAGVSAQAIAYESHGGGAPVTPRAVELLRQTRPWVILFSVLMFIMAGFIMLAALVLLFLGFAVGNAQSGMSFGVMSLLYVGMGLLYFVPALFLWRYGSRIGTLVQTGRSGELEFALEAQKSFWKFVGIAAVVVISIYILVIIAALAMGGLGALR